MVTLYNSTIISTGLCCTVSLQIFGAYLCSAILGMGEYSVCRQAAVQAEILMRLKCVLAGLGGRNLNEPKISRHRVSTD